jgi:hypothetical protein
MGVASSVTQLAVGVRRRRRRGYGIWVYPFCYLYVANLGFFFLLFKERVLRYLGKAFFVCLPNSNETCNVQRISFLYP